MSDVKTMVFPEVGSGSNALETALLAGGGGMNGFNNPLWALIFLAFLGRNGGLWGGNGENNCQLSQIQAQLNSNQGQQLLMDAIKGNNSAVHELATTLNCDVNAITTAINGVQSAICNVSNQVGMSSAQVINAIQSGNSQLAGIVTNMGYENRIANMQQTSVIQNGFAQIGFQSAQDTCAIKQNATDNTGRILAKLDAIEDSRKDREIASLTAQLTAANSRAERAAELAPINKALADIQCRQPSVVTVPYPNVTAVPTALAYQYYGNGYYNTNGGFL